MATEIPAPLRGKAVTTPADKSPTMTTFFMNNIRPVDTLARRIRLGQRPGLDKWGNGTLVGGSEQPVVAMCVVSSVV